MVWLYDFILLLNSIYISPNVTALAVSWLHYCASDLSWDIQEPMRNLRQIFTRTTISTVFPELKAAVGGCCTLSVDNNFILCVGRTNDIICLRYVWCCCFRRQGGADEHDWCDNHTHTHTHTHTRGRSNTRRNRQTDRQSVEQMDKSLAGSSLTGWWPAVDMATQWQHQQLSPLTADGCGRVADRITEFTARPITLHPLYRIFN